MRLIRWNPHRNLSTFDRFFDSVINGSEEGSLLAAPNTPNVDIKETKDEFLVSVELPGLSKEDVDVKIENGVLAISGERKFERDEEKEDYRLVERRYGNFCRSFDLGENVDTGKVGATMDKGVLTVALAKKEADKPKKIEVNIH